MKLKNIGRAALATALSLGIGLGATACSRDYTVAYVYAVSQQNATVSAFAVDYQSGALTQINGSPFTVTETTPKIIVASPSGKFIYVMGYQTSNIEVFAVGTDGKLYGQQNPSLVGSYPTAAAIDSTGSFLYVAFTLQPGSSTSSPGKGGVDIFPINTNASSSSYGQLGTPVTVNSLQYIPTGNNPVGIAISEPYCATTSALNSMNPTCTGANGAGNYSVFAYVLDQENTTNPGSTSPTILGYSQNMTNGALTLLTGSTCSTVASVPCTGYAAGVMPSAIAVEPTSRYVYVTDENTNQILSYGIGSNTNGNLTGLVSSPTATGLYPENLTIDPRGKFLLTANYNSSTISSYTINAANGSLGGTAGTAAATVNTGPTCVTIEPALGIYVYTSNLLDNSISAEQMNPSTGALTQIANTPFPTSSQPACLVAVANGDHAESIVNP